MSIGKVIFQWFQQYLYCTSVVYLFVNWMNEKNEWLPTVLCFVFKIFEGHKKIHTLNSISFVFKRFWLYLALVEWELKMWHGVTVAASSFVAIAIGCKSSVLFPHQLFLVLCVLTPPESRLAHLTIFFPNECNFWSNNGRKVIIFALICFVTCLTHLAKPILHGGATFNPGPNILSQTIQGGSLDLISKSWYWLLFSLSCFSRRSRLPNNEAQNHYTTGLFPADSVEKLSTLRRPFFSYELHILKSGRVLFTHSV